MSGGHGDLTIPPRPGADRLTQAPSLCSSPRSRAGPAPRTHRFDLLDGPMFAIVRTGGKQYRVAAGDKIVVEKLAGAAGDAVTPSDGLFAGGGGGSKSTAGATLSAGIVAPANADKGTPLKKKRRPKYPRQRGH